MNNKINIFNKNIDTYVICSTQNQIVNYIPLKQFNIKKQKEMKIINIKVNSQQYVREHANTNEWDNWFDKALSDDGLINRGEFYDDKNNENAVCLNRNFNLSEYKREINYKIQNRNSILWNITGGQRSVVIAIKNIFRKRIKEGKEDYLIYLEGNTNKIICGFGEDGKIKYEENEEIKHEENKEIKYEENEVYNVPHEFSIKKALSLAGFDYNIECPNLLDSNNKLLDLDDGILERFYNNYININNHDFRQLIIATGKKENKYGCKIGDDAWGKLEEEDKTGEIKKIHNKLKEKKSENNSQILGFLFEVLTVSIIKRVIKGNEKYKNYFKELVYSLRVINNRNDLDTRVQFCEFDIVLLSNAGQLVFFECKGGFMGGETARARHYTSYAVGGVYGTPIIITPLLKDEINSKGENIYGSIYSCINAAKRANMDVWGIDELDCKIGELFDSYFVGGK